MSLFGLFHNKSESVCQEHLQIATQGIYPGFSHFQMALSGFGCSISIEIIPPKQGPSNGTWEAAEYVVTITVKWKGKTFRSVYKLPWFDYTVKVSASFANFVKISVSIKDFIKKKLGFETKLNSIEPVATEFVVEPKETKFKIRRTK
jgi:hypothetical protein